MSLRVLSSGVVALGVALLTVSPALAHCETAILACSSMQPSRPAARWSGRPEPDPTDDEYEPDDFVRIGPDTEVSVTGTAEQEYLKSGVIVEFVAEVDKAHVVKEKIDHLTIVSSTTDRPAGLSPPEFATAENKGEKGDERRPSRCAIPRRRGRRPRPVSKKDADPPGGDLSPGKPGKAQTGLEASRQFTVLGTIKM